MYFRGQYYKNKLKVLQLAVWLLLFLNSLDTAFSLNAANQSDIGQIINHSNELRMSGDYSAARLQLNKALIQANEQGDKNLIAKVNNLMGILGIYEYKFPEALVSLQKALTLYREIEDDEGIAECLNNIASIHMSLNNYQQAKENYKQSLKIRESGSDLRKLGVSYSNLGLVFNRIAELDSALFYHHLSLGIWETLNDLAGVGVTLNHIGSTLREQGDLEGALVVFEESLEKLEAAKDIPFVTVAFVKSDIGGILEMLGRYEEAIAWCTDLCFETTGSHFLSSSRNCCKALYKAYTNVGNYPYALRAFKKYTEFKDSILGTSTIKEVTRLELSYAFDQIHQADSLRFETERQLQQERINKQRIGLLAIGGSLLLLTLLIIVILKGKKRSEELLLNILPAAVAKELKQTGQSIPKKYDSVSVIFADIKGFTKISENLSPEKLLEQINIYFTAFDLIMGKYGIEKIKTIGDCYMAVSGLPIERIEHAVIAVKAALEMQDFMHSTRELKTANNEPFFEIRIGIHSGPVVAGIVGTKKFQYDIWGDTVNTANRVETNSETGKVNVSGRTFELIKDHFDCTYRGEIGAKGKGEISMYFVNSPII